MLRVLVTNIKGGCGKTTLATNLAAAFAAGGFATGLAEVDRQKSSLTWLRLRGDRQRPIEALDWRKEVGEAPDRLQRLIIDAPANLRMRHVDELIGAADLVVVPVLASVFDEGSTERFLAKLEELKPIRKGRKSVALVANRLRSRSKATQRLEAFLAGLDDQGLPKFRLWRAGGAGPQHLRPRRRAGSARPRGVAATAQHDRGDRLSAGWQAALPLAMV